MSTDAEAGDGVEEQDDAFGAEEAIDEEHPYFVEVWNDYDPSMRFAAIFPLQESHGAKAGTVAYYIIEPGKHTGLHSDNAEEIVFVTEGEGEVFAIGNSTRLEAGKFAVFPAGTDHDIYAQGAVPLRLLSFFPVTEIESTFQQAIYPMGGTTLSSKPVAAPAPVVTELDPNNLPEDFPFALDELGMAPEEEEARELSPTQKLLGMREDGTMPDDVVIRVIDPNNPDENVAAVKKLGPTADEQAPADDPEPAGE
ncbi:MAG TPA: cupin domain-containing protein [Gaiellaceae bacterium]|jgi:quercetin dioxygenase-like cupin family protein